jgi:predicted permease
MAQFLFIFSIIVLGFATGQFIRTFRTEWSERVRYVTVFFAMRIAIPLAVCLALWQLQTLSWQLLVLPLSGFAVLMGGFTMGWLLSRLQKQTDVQRAVYAPAGGYLNIGAIGSLVVFVFMGESGLALVPLFKIFEELVYFGFFFPYAAKHSPLSNIKSRQWWQDPVLLIMISVLTLGFVLNVGDVPRPEVLNPLSQFLVPLGTYSLMISVGLSFSLGSLKQYWKSALLLVVCKQLALPIMLAICLGLLGVGQYYDGLILQVAVALAFMPMAFIVVVPAALYKLDQALVNACWLISTVVFLVMLPFFPLVFTLL